MDTQFRLLPTPSPTDPPSSTPVAHANPASEPASQIPQGLLTEKEKPPPRGRLLSCLDKM